MFTRDIVKAIMISDAMETGTVQINSAPARGPDHFPFQVEKDYYLRERERERERVSVVNHRWRCEERERER